MESNEESEQRRVVVTGPGVRREVITEQTQRGPDEKKLSMGTIALVAILVIGAIAVVFFVVSNRNANEAANRNANIDVASRANEVPPAPIVQQPAPQAPIIIQQPAPPPVIIQQPAPAIVEDKGLKEDMAMQDAATKILLSDPDMAAVSIVITGTRAALSGSVNSERTKERAERLVKAVRGVTSVDNKIYVPAA